MANFFCTCKDTDFLKWSFKLLADLCPRMSDLQYALIYYLYCLDSVHLVLLENGLLFVSVP